jgi:PAS domain S-box-containing protein
MEITSMHTDQSRSSRFTKPGYEFVIQKEANLNAIVENFDGFVWSIDSDLRYIILNTALRNKIKEVLDVDARPGDKMLDILEMLDPSKRKEWNLVYERGFRGERLRFVNEFMIAGQAATFEISINPIFEEDLVTGLSCFARDITEETRNAQQLKASEVRFRSLIENSSDIIVVVDAEARIMYGSPSIGNVFGVPAGDYMGFSAFEFLHPDDIPGLIAKYMELLQQPGEPMQIEARAQTRDGRLIWVEGIVTNWLEKEGINGIVCNFRDVTERILAAQSLEQSELKFRSLIEHCADFIMMASVEGVFTYGSPSVQKYLGYEQHEYIGKPVFTFIHPDSIDTARELLQNVITTPGKLFTICLKLVQKNGAEMWVEGLASNLLHVAGVNALVGNFRDISGRMKAEQMVRESEDLYRNLFNKSPLPIWLCDAATLKILEANEATIKHYGYSRKELLKMTVFNLVPQDEHATLKKLLEEDLQPDKHHVLRRHVKKNAEIIYVEVLAHMISYKGQNAFLVVANDITEKIRLQHELMDEKIYRHKEITKAAIEAQEKERESIGREMHDNVTQILTTAKLCLSCAADNPAMTQEMIQRSSKTITAAIEEIRKLSKSMIQVFHREVGLRLSIDDLLESIRLSNKFKATLEFSLPDEQRLDDKLKMTIFRIIQEQLNNILKHANASAIHVTIRQNAGIVSLDITDNGQGFNIQEKRKGIGISNIINRAELFNGHVEINTSPGRGCHMHVDFKIH